MDIAPSLLAADFSQLGEEVKKVATADFLHLDVMDGCFVPNLSIGPQVIAALRPKSSLVFDVHLMLAHPLPYIRVFRDAGAEIIGFHVECGDNAAELIAAIKASGAKPAMAIKPKTPVEEILPYCRDLYMVTVMTVEPGFGGQKLMPEALEKIKAIKAANPRILCEVDGGVNRETLEACKAAGADILVAGTAVFKSQSPQKEIEFLRGNPPTNVGNGLDRSGP